MFYVLNLISTSDLEEEINLYFRLLFEEVTENLNCKMMEVILKHFWVVFFNRYDFACSI